MLPNFHPAKQILYAQDLSMSNSNRIFLRYYVIIIMAFSTLHHRCQSYTRYLLPAIVFKMLLSVFTSLDNI